MVALTRPIPEEAMPVVQLIRERVKRPEDLPELVQPFASCRSVLRFVRGNGAVRVCPMGLDKTAIMPLPTDAYCFSICSPFRNSDVGVRHCGLWWDEQQNAQAAVDAVWGEQG